jgi:hypothetical protein
VRHYPLYDRQRLDHRIERHHALLSTITLRQVAFQRRQQIGIGGITARIPAGSR